MGRGIAQPLCDGLFANTILAHAGQDIGDGCRPGDAAVTVNQDVLIALRPALGDVEDRRRHFGLASGVAQFEMMVAWQVAEGCRSSVVAIENRNHISRLVARKGVASRFQGTDHD